MAGIIKIIKKMSIKNELLEFRGVLEEWEKHPPKVIRSVLM